MIKNLNTQASDTETFRIPVSESDLVRDIARVLGYFLEVDNDDWTLQREVGIGARIADLVAFKAPQSWALTDIDSLTTKECVILYVLRRLGPTRIDFLEQKCGYDRGQLRNGELSRLVNSGLVNRSIGGRVALTENWTEKPQVIAFEAKLRRWRDALRQAIEYKRYADEVYVVLPVGSARPALAKSQMFRKAGVGLLVMTDSGLQSVIRAMPNIETHDWRREYICSLFLSRASGSLICAI